MIFIPFFVLFCTEILKVTIQSIKNKRFDASWIFHSGGMPSGHSAFTTSIATVVAYMNGYHSPEFLIALGFAIIVMYDARGVRRTVGYHAREINKLTKTHALEEFVGHTNWEVVMGAVCGVSFTVLFLRFGTGLIAVLETMF